MINLVIWTICLSVIALIISIFDRRGDKVHAIGRFWAGMHLKACGIKVTLDGIENIKRPPYIFMCNHQSALDIYALLSSLPLSFKWIAKRQLFMIPFIGWAMKRAGYISLDRENPKEALKAMEDAARKIREGMNIIIFPEGTRSKDGVLLPFKKGGFSLAIRAGVPIVPVGITGTSRLQPKGSFIPSKKGVIYINIGREMSMAGKGKSARTEVMNEVRAEIEKRITDSEMRKADSEKRKAKCEMRRAESEKRKAESEMRRAESEMRNADSGERRAKCGMRKAESEKRKAECEMRKADSEMRNAKSGMRKAKCGMRKVKR